MSCYWCKQWYHKCCVLINPYEEKEAGLFLCPFCVQKQTPISPIVKTLKQKQFMFPSVNAIPHTELSIFLEKRLSQWIEKRRKDISKELNMFYDDVAYPHDLSVREVLNEVLISLSVLLELYFPVRKMVSMVLSEC